MANDAIPEFEARLALHRVDDGVRATVAEFWPIFAPHLDRAVDELIDAMVQSPTAGSTINAARIVRERREIIKALEVGHFKVLLSGNLDQRYAELCRRTVQQETAIGLTPVCAALPEASYSVRRWKRSKGGDCSRLRTA